MPDSMTSFGRHRAVAGGRDITVEIRSVNNRFYDCQIRLPRHLNYIEDKIKQHFKSLEVSRGKVDVFISAEKSADPPQEQNTIGLDLNLAAEYIASLKSLRDTFDLKDDISVMTVAARQDLFVTVKEKEDAEADFQAVRSVIDVAAAEFLAGRAAEGEKLAEDIRQKLFIISRKLENIKNLSDAQIKGCRHRFEERLRGILADSGFSAEEGKVLTECAAYADRVSVDEEAVRLESHLEAFHSIMKTSEPMGRKLDFLTQEMNREINTIGSKSQNAEISMLVVEVKCEIEKIREQVQNLE